MQEDSKFYVYSKPGCGFCGRLTEFMDSHRLGYEKLTLGYDYKIEEFLEKFGNNCTFPQVTFENQKIGGMKDTVRYIMEQQMV